MSRYIRKDPQDVNDNTAHLPHAQGTFKICCINRTDWVTKSRFVFLIIVDICDIENSESTLDAFDVTDNRISQIHLVSIGYFNYFQRLGDESYE